MTVTAIVRRLFPGLFYERTKSGARIYVNSSGTTSVNINEVMEAMRELTSESEKMGMYDPPIPWIPCAMRNPIGPGTYLCFEPEIGPGPDFVFLRWDTDRGWRDDSDNKGFPTHWVRLEIPYRA